VDGRLDDAAYARLVHGDETLVVHKGEEAHDELAVHSIRDAAVAGDRFAEILDFERAFKARREEAAERRDEGGEGGEYEDMELHGRDVNGSREKPQGGEGVLVRDENWVRGASKAGKDVGAEVLGEKELV
jgi:hypothetical protein